MLLLFIRTTKKKNILYLKMVRPFLVVEIAGNLHQAVGGAGHGGQDVDVGSTLPDQAGYVFDACRAADGSASEFQNFHGTTNFDS